jgi:GH18 family chitinase
MKIKHFIFLFLNIFFINTTFAAPAVYSYWAGWSNTPIPNIHFDGLFLAFAFMKVDDKGNYYTDYSLSGNFHKPHNAGPYVTWNNWLHTFYNSGSRAYVAYGGGTNADFRGYVINANDEQLSKMAGEIKLNIKLYYFDGVDLDIENWWSFGTADNEKFARNLATLVKYLRKSLDSDAETKGKGITIAVAFTSAGSVPGLQQYDGSATATMLPFFKDSEAMNAIKTVNIMSYNTCISDFYSKHDLVASILNVFNQAGIPKEKIIFGIQPYECGEKGVATSPEVIMSLGQFIKDNNYGGLFMWSIGNNIDQTAASTYINAMKSGLGVQ